MFFAIDTLLAMFVASAAFDLDGLKTRQHVSR